jgi:hypothetical protein
MNALSLVQPRLTTGNLAAYDGFDFNELYQFMQIFHQNINNTITDSEKFPGEMPTPRNRVSLPNATYELLVKYYNDTYDWNFVSIADLSLSGLSSVNSIVVLPIIIQFGRIQIAAKIFGSKSAPQYQKSSYILAKFIQEDKIIDIYPGHIQYYFEHTVQLPTGPKTYRLALSTGIYERQMRKQGSIAESAIRMIKVAMLNCGNMIFINYLETPSC